MANANNSPRGWFWFVVALVLITPASVTILAKSFGGGAGTETVTPIAWQTDLAVAQRQAMASGQRVLVYYTASWCEPCRWMKLNTWPNDRLVKLIFEQFVPVMVDMSDGKIHQWAEQYGVMGTPTVVVTDAGGALVTGVEGVMGPQQMYDFLSGAAIAAAQATTTESGPTFPIPPGRLTVGR